MAHFKYTALSHDGQRVSGVIEGYDELDAASRVKESCAVIIKLTEIKEKESGGILHMEIGGNRLNGRAFGVMCSQFAITLSAGIPIARAVRLVAEKTTDRPLRKIIDQVAEDVEGGRSLSSAFADRGDKLLPVTFFETLRAGEATGNIAGSFATMQAHFEKQSKMRGKVRGAMAYPMFVLATAVVVVAVLMAKVVPTFTSMFAELGAELPLPTRILIAVSDFFSNYILIIVAVIAAIIIGVKLYGTTQEGKLRLARLKLHLPILGRIEELGAASQFANTMATMMGAGLTMDRAIAITSKVVDNYHLSKQTEELGEQLQMGRTLGASMRELTDYPDILVDMTAVGESTGELSETLGTIAGYYDTELEETIQAALGKLEPILLVGIALIAGFIVIAVYLAVFSMYGAMGNM